MFTCLLCLQEKQNQLEINSKKGRELKCSVIIAKHFWFQPKADDNFTETVCSCCWDILLAFHNLYETVAKAHNYFESEVLTSSIELEPEVKVELDSLELLPKVEVHEATNALSAIPLFDLTGKVQTTAQLQSEGNVNTKEELNPLCTKNLSDDDWENDLPLSRLRSGKDIKTDVELDCHSVAKNDEPPDYDFCGIESSQSESENKSDADFSLNKQNLKEKKDFDSESDSNTELDSDYEPIEEETRRPYNKRNKSTKKFDDDIAKYFEKLECHKCKETFSIFSHLRQHVETAHNKPVPTIICCGRTFQKGNTLAYHALFHLNPKNVKCQHCKYVFKTDALLCKHMETSHKCSQCVEILPNEKELRQHLMKEHSITPACEFFCDQCKKSFETKNKLSEHKRSYHGEKQFCEICGTCVSSKRALYRHLRKHRDPANARDLDPVQCDICGKWIKYQNNLRQHKKWVHGEDRYKLECPICKKVTASKNSLSGHMLRMHRSESIPCTVCEKVFRCKADLTDHMNIHTKEKQFTCEICSAVFLRKSSHKKHIEAMHTNRPKLRFQCDVCNEFVHSAHYLRLHKIRKHERSNMKTPCPICGRESVNEVALHKHIWRRHGAKDARTYELNVLRNKM